MPLLPWAASVVQAKSSKPEDRARMTAPAFISIKTSSIPNAGMGAFAEACIPVSFRAVSLPCSSSCASSSGWYGVRPLPGHTYRWRFRIRTRRVLLGAEVSSSYVLPYSSSKSVLNSRSSAGPRFIDGSNTQYSNWMRYINSSRRESSAFCLEIRRNCPPHQWAYSIESIQISNFCRLVVFRCQNDNRKL